MGEYKYSGVVNEEKVFIINRSELNERLDCNYNQALKTNKIDSIYPLRKLSKIHKSASGGTPSKENENYWNGKIPWASPKDIKKYNLFETKDYITMLGVNNSSTKIIEPNNLLIVFRALKKGEINCSINRVPMAINQDLKALYFDSDINIEYILILFRVFQKRLFPLITKLGTTVYSINTVEFEKLKVPIPPSPIQQKIVDQYQKAYNQKQQKEKEAQELLASVDTYLLNELGITLPKKDNSLESRINSNVRLRDLTGSRFDPMLYDKYTIALKECLKKESNNNFKTLALKKLITKSVAGDWGIEENDTEEIDTHKRCLVIRATEFDNNYNLKLKNSRVKYRLIKKEKLEKIDIKANDLLIEKSGGSLDQPVGRISILTNDIIHKHSICYSNFIHKIRVDDKIINPQYLFCFLKTIHNIKLTESMQSQTNGIRNLIMSTYFNQTIILPSKQNGDIDLERQNEIANHISTIRAKAKKLEKEAKNGLEIAKQEIEQLILGTK